MLIYKDLFVKCSEVDARRILSGLKNAVAHDRGWCVDEEWMSALLNPDYGYEDGLFSVVCRKSGTVKTYGVVLLYGKTKRQLYIPNIVPVVAHDLTTVEYNVCFDEFWSSIGKRVFKGKKAKFSGGEVACEDLLSPTLKRFFNTFSITANRQSLHPCDETRWRDFVIQMALSRKRLDERQVRCLFDEFGWPRDISKRMAERYAYELAIVRQSKGCRV